MIYSAPPFRQQGVVLLVTLVALVLLLITTIALLQSARNSSLASGNIGFRRDLTNQAERGVTAAIGIINQLGTSGAWTATDATKNYSAVMLPSSKYGIPDELLNSTSAYTANNTLTDSSNGISVSFVIDRMCNTAGTASLTNCMLKTPQIPGGKWLPTTEAQPPLPSQVIYRISVRAVGPKNTQLFMQSTVLK
ncbi:hypothetical protein [Silvimonas sp.]|uniref:hypothetical protein n=1 Tax=Silvimonas sp. TaxID=2650811 RepID=UPI0028432FB6|nr:hypothetical protein [Silvimonas sp.]MDR3429821.1 hypothetical protein [Silvimonas sp.]